MSMKSRAGLWEEVEESHLRSDCEGSPVTYFMNTGRVLQNSGQKESQEQEPCQPHIGAESGFTQRLVSKEMNLPNNQRKLK